MANTSAETPQGDKAPSSAPAVGDTEHAATANAEGAFKLVGVPEGSTVAGGTMLAAIRAWTRRRQSRKRDRDPRADAPDGVEAAERRAMPSDADVDQPVPEGETPVSDMRAHASPEPPLPDKPPGASSGHAVETETEVGTDPTKAPSIPPIEARPDPVSERRAAARRGGGQDRIDAQHARGKLTARERIKRILDADSFEEIAPYVEHRHSGFGLEKHHHAGDGVVTGFGRIDGRRVAIFAQDFTVLGGSFSEIQALKVGRLLESATSAGLPIIALLDSVGARIQEGVWSLAGFGDLFWRNTQASGVVPQISLMLGPCAGGAVYSPGLTDFVVMTRGNSFMFITGPDVIRTVTGEEVDVETLGGATTHAAGSGVAHFVADDENGAFALTRHLLSYLPSNNVDDPPALPADDKLVPDIEQLDHLIPESAELSYDVRDAIRLVADRDSFLEVHADYAQNAVVGFARLSGRVVAFIANQPAHLAGVLDINASDKIARFIRFSDAFNIPIVTLIDCPGFLPGTSQEHQGIIRHGAKIVYAYSEATVPKISVVLRKAYGGAYIVMSSKMIRTDVCLAWPSAEIAVMGPKGAVSILYAKQLAAADPAKRDAERARLEDEFKEKFNSPFVAASTGHIDDVIYPRETRARVTAALDFLKDKQTTPVPKKHGNIPL
ncbi:MAG: acyl-CoA carboxylase subunit beta [Acidobacteriota bacterium]|nr:acyl-CoA carboxylase subunit beta [Acidobacteriota bacterium]